MPKALALIGLCPGRLGRIDATLTLTLVGSLDAGSSVLELTGNGNSELWGFFAMEKPTPLVAAIDKSTAGTIRKAPQPVVQLAGGKGASYAFAFWAVGLV